MERDRLAGVSERAGLNVPSAPAWPRMRQVQLEALGAVSQRAAVGHRARGLQPDGNAWDYFPHDQARSRAYRWGEDGIAGISDDQPAAVPGAGAWNGQDPILKERLFGLTNGEGNHGEDVKELYYYLDATPTHSYLKMLYKYPQREFPYDRLVEENRRRGRDEPEFELLDTGVFDDDRYFDVFVEYAKAGARRHPDAGHGAQPRPGAGELHVLPQLWFRNTWSWRADAQPPAICTPTTARPIAVKHASCSATTLCTPTASRRCCSATTRPTSARLFGDRRRARATSRTPSTSIVVARPARRREPGAARHQGRRLTIALDDPGAAAARDSACGWRTRHAGRPVRRLRRRCCEQRRAEADEFYAELQAGARRRGRPAASSGRPSPA